MYMPTNVAIIWAYGKAGIRNPESGTTGKNKGFPFLDILGYLKNTHKKSQIWQSETSPKQGIPN